MASVEQLKQDLFGEHGIVDPNGVHSVFAGGNHGQKVNFDKILNDSSLFCDVVEVTADAIDRNYLSEEVGELILLSVASGTNRFVTPIAERVGDRVKPAFTVKSTRSKAVSLESRAEKLIAESESGLVVVIEDVGTSGFTSSTAVISARNAGARRVEVANILQRRERLESLDIIRCAYRAIIHEVMPDYSPDECMESGFCADGWELIERGVPENPAHMPGQLPFLDHRTPA